MDATRPDVAHRYLAWNAVRSAAFRGYWLVTSLYMVVVAELSPFQLVFLGTAMELTVLASEMPTGVMADTVSRKWSIVVSHALMGVGVVATGLVTGFGPLVATQMLWGLGWTFASGADVAWVTDELDDRSRIDGVLVRAGSLRLVGAAVGMTGLGLVAWATSLGVAIVAAGVIMAALGPAVAVGFPERNFTPTREDRVRESAAILRRGLTLVRRDREILIILISVSLLSIGAEAYDRLHPSRLVTLGFPDQPDPIVWFTVLGVVTLLLGAVLLRFIQHRIDDVPTARWSYAGAGGLGAVGMALLAHAPSGAWGIAGVVLVSGVAWNVTRTVSEIWVNRRATSDVRATVQSLLGQVESFGEIGGGLVFGAVAQLVSVPAALTGSSLLIAVASLVVALDGRRPRRRRRRPDPLASSSVAADRGPLPASGRGPGRRPARSGR